MRVHTQSVDVLVSVSIVVLECFVDYGMGGVKLSGIKVGSWSYVRPTRESIAGLDHSGTTPRNYERSIVYDA